MHVRTYNYNLISFDLTESERAFNIYIDVVNSSSFSTPPHYALISANHEYVHTGKEAQGIMRESTIPFQPTVPMVGHF